MGTRTLDALLEDKGAVDELEALKKVTEKIGTLSVCGGLDGVLNELCAHQSLAGGVPERSGRPF